MSAPGWDELALIEGIVRRATWDRTSQILGDDAAVLPASSVPITVCADALVEGVHFDLGYWTPAQVGTKAVTVNISDLAAMAAEPRWILATIAAPKDFDVSATLQAIEQRAAYYGARLIGGDLTKSGEVSISVTAIGAQVGPALRRSGAQPGDTIFVTGPLGLAAAGLKGLAEGRNISEEARSALLDPTARVREALLAAQSGAHAAIDISDGLALDLHRLATASRVGFELTGIPIAAGATESEALGGGEDFELLFTAPDPQLVIKAFHDAQLIAPLVIGKIVHDQHERYLCGTPLDAIGYRH